MSSFGKLIIDPMPSTNQLPGIRANSNPWQVVSTFLKAGEGRAERLVENRKGILILMSIPNRPNSGAIYLYSYRSKRIYMLRFDREDDFSAAEFETIFREYNLEQYILRGVPCETGGNGGRTSRSRCHGWRRHNRSNRPTPTASPNGVGPRVRSQYDDYTSSSAA